MPSSMKNFIGGVLAAVVVLSIIAAPAHAATTASSSTPVPQTAVALYRLVEENPTPVYRLQFHTGDNDYVTVYLKGVAATSDVPFSSAGENRQMQALARSEGIVVGTQNDSDHSAAGGLFFLVVIVILIALSIGYNRRAERLSRRAQ